MVGAKDPTAHAEMEAIRAAARSLGSFTLTGCDLYASAQPCPMCLGATYWARLDRVFYGNSVKDTAAIGFDDEVFYRQLTCSRTNARFPRHRCWRRRLGACFASMTPCPEPFGTDPGL